MRLCKLNKRTYNNMAEILLEAAINNALKKEAHMK